MSRKCALSGEDICNILQTTSYSDSEGDDIEIDSNDEYIPPPCSSSDEGSSMEEAQVTEDTPVVDDTVVSEGKFVTEYVALLNMIVLLKMWLLLNSVSE